MWSSLALLLWTAAVLGVDAAPAPSPSPPPAQLVTRPVHWQEFPVALVPLVPLEPNATNNSSYKPILPGSDHGLYNEGFFEGDIVRSAKHPDVKNAVTDPSLLWPFGTVVFKVDDDVGCPDSPQCDILMAAMEHYHEHSCIRFKEWTGEDNFVTIFFNSDSSGACWSPVGRVGDGEQRLSLGQRCWYKGIVIHELGHAIGFWHEMNRPDRDDWIYVYWHNIIPGFASAFRKHNPRTVATLGEKFDYRSIMMYDEYAFSKDGRSPTLQAVTGEEIGPIWRKKGLSDSDKRRLQKLYKCEPTKPKPGFPYDVNCDFNKHVCGFKNGGNPAWNWRTVNRTDGYVYTSSETSGTKPGHFVSINYPPISSELETVRGPLGCVRFYYLLSGESSGAKLQLEQAYLNKITQLLHDESATFELWSNDTAGNEWIHLEIPLYVTRPFKLIFTSSFNDTSSPGTIALDDVEVLYHPCNPKPNETSTPPPSIPKPPTTTAKPSTDAAGSTTATSTTTSPSSTSSSPTTPTPTSSSTASETESDAPPQTTTLSSVTESTTEANGGSTTASQPSQWTTATTDEELQQIQLQQQQQMLVEQQLLELEQQKVQQQQLLELQQQLQQHLGSETSKATEQPSSAMSTSSTSSTSSSSSTSSEQTTDRTSTTTFTFPITLGESFDVTTTMAPTKIPNMPNPTNKIPLVNPSHHSSPTTTKTSDYDVDESLSGR